MNNCIINKKKKANAMGVLVCMYVCTCQLCIYVQSTVLGDCLEGIHNAGTGVKWKIRTKLRISTLLFLLFLFG